MGSPIPGSRAVGWRNIDFEPWGRQFRRPAERDVSGHRPPCRTPEARVRVAVERVVDLLRTIDREARRAERTIPTPQEREVVASKFWSVIRELETINRGLSDSARGRCVSAAREVLHPWLFRSDYWSRSYLKPHGHAGDFRTLEWIYDLERDPCADLTKPVVINLLDYLYRTMHCVRAMWHRRRWYAELVSHLVAANHTRPPLRILDLGCCGSRYVRDVIGYERDPTRLELTLLDPDPAALAFVRGWLPNRLRGCTRLICGPVQHVRELVRDHAVDAVPRFDLVLSTGLLGYLDQRAATDLLSDMTELARPGGLVAVSNFTPEDASRIVRDWIIDWPLICRPVPALRGLVPGEHAVGFDRSPDGGLVHALVSAPVNRKRPSPARTR